MVKKRTKKKTLPVFRLKDRVVWRSHARGRYTSKAGEILAVMQAQEKIPQELLLGNVYNFKSCAMAIEAQAKTPPEGLRDHKSYLVAVPGSLGKKPLVYFPEVDKLELTSNEDEGGKTPIC